MQAGTTPIYSNFSGFRCVGPAPQCSEEERRTQRRGLRLRLTRQRQREQPTPGSNTPKGAAGGCSDVARNEPLSESRNTQRPPHEPPARERRRGPCEVPIFTIGDSRTRRLESTGRAAAVVCSLTGWRSLRRQDSRARCKFSVEFVPADQGFEAPLLRSAQSRSQRIRAVKLPSLRGHQVGGLFLASGFSP